MKLTKRWGYVLLGIWLIITGLTAVIFIPIQGLDAILAILAVIAGALLLLGK